MKLFLRFSPRNGEAILKDPQNPLNISTEGFSPRNGEAILKIQLGRKHTIGLRFSPRNGGRKWYSVPFTHRYVYLGDRLK